MARKTTDGGRRSDGDRKPMPSGSGVPTPQAKSRYQRALVTLRRSQIKSDEEVARAALEVRTNDLLTRSERRARHSKVLEALRAGRTPTSQTTRPGVIFLDPVTLKQIRQPLVVMATFDREDYAAQWQADFGQKLAAARVKQGISQSELARRSGLQQSHISKLEAGRMEPRVTTIFTLADTIGIRAGALFPADPR